MSEQQVIEIPYAIELLKECGIKNDAGEFLLYDRNFAISMDIEALEEMQKIRAYLEPLRNYNTHNEHLEKLKELVGK